MQGEVDRLRKAAGRGRNGHRNSTMIYMAYRHGLRVSELVRLKWDQILWEEEDIQIQRRKGSESGTHPMDDFEMKALRKLPGDHIGWVFRSERGDRLTERGFFQMLARAGRAAELGFAVRPHMLRHGCGYRLNSEGRNTRTIQGWLGHVNIANTAIYTALAADHFRKEGLGRKKGG